MKRGHCGSIAILTAAMMALAAPQAFAADVIINAATTFATADASDGLADGTFTVTGNLTITSTGSITCDDPAAPPNDPACPIVIVVTGNMLMEAGSKITADNNNASGAAGNITMTVGGNMTMCGQTGSQAGCLPSPGFPGALISATNGGSNAGDVGGIVTITVGNIATATGSFYMEGGSTTYGAETGAKIIVTAAVLSGDINITSGGTYFAEPGSVVEAGDGNGFETQQGGKIFLISDCGLTTQGRVTSKGTDPGADLVHLESCEVRIEGLVESTGKAHGGPFANSCHGLDDAGVIGEVIRSGKPEKANACIEVWGKVVTIDSASHLNPNDLGSPLLAGELNTDVGDGGADGESWIDIVAYASFTVIDGTGNDFLRNNKSGTTYFSTYAVHANAIDGSDTSPNVITALVKNGPLTASGKAFEASSTLTNDTGHGPTNNFTGNGSAGGTVRLEALGSVNLDTAFINASGDFDGGPPCPSGSGACGDGGHIIVKAWGAGSDISWQTGSGDVRPNDTGGGTTGGDIILRACDSITTGADFHGETEDTATGGANCDATKPDIPSYVPLNDLLATWALCGGSTISGRKYNSLTGDGLDGWEIHLFNSSGSVHLVQTTAGGGLYSFSGVPPGTYTLCEKLKSGWTQTFPTSGANCVTPGDPAADNTTPGPIGYTIDLTNGACCAGQEIVRRDFGNEESQPLPPTCPEDPNRAASLTRTVDVSKPLGGGGVPGNPANYHKVQDAYNAAANTGEVIGLFSNTNENLILGGAKTLTITQCTLAKVTGAAGSPVWDVQSTGKLTIVGPDSVGGNIGWRVNGNGGHQLKAVRAYNATQYGVLILSSGNGVSFNSVSGSPVGVRIQGNSNIVKSGTISGNGTGVEVAGNSNTLSGSTVGPNTGVGVLVSGNNNTIKGVSALQNGGGFKATGTGNLFDSNKAYKNTGIGFETTSTATGTKFKNNSSNTGNSGSSNENSSFEYKFGAVATNQGGNKKDNVSFASTAVGNYE